MARAELHHLIKKWEPRPAWARFLHRTEREVKKMPLLFYLPFIIWMGLFEVAERKASPRESHQGAPET